MTKSNINLKDYINIPKIYIIIYLLCLGGVIAVFIIHILPGWNRISEKNSQITVLKSNIRKQEKLFPFYEILLEKNSSLYKYDIQNLSNLQECRPEGLMFEINELCRENQTEMINFKPIVNMTNEKSDIIGFNIDLQGLLINLKNTLKQAAMLSCLERIEKINISKEYKEYLELDTHKLKLIVIAAKEQTQGS